jgi:uncharacterized protein with HEPN domain
MRSSELYLTDIVEAADAIEEFTSDVEFGDFVRDDMRRSAVVQKLTVIGEAVARLPQDFRDRHPDIEWSKIVGVRNILVHGYFSVNFSIIFTTAKKNVPELRRKIAIILEQEFRG